MGEDSIGSVHLNTIQKAVSEIEVQLAVLRAELEQGRAKRDPFAVHVFESRRSYNYAVDHSGKGNNRIDREVQRTYVKAMDLGYKGSIREWREVLMAWAAPKKDPMMAD